MIATETPSPAKIKASVSAAALHAARDLLKNFVIQPMEHPQCGQSIPVNEYNVAVLIDVDTSIGRVYDSLEKASILLAKMDMEASMSNQPLQVRCAEHRLEIASLLKELDILFNRLPKYGSR